MGFRQKLKNMFRRGKVTKKEKTGIRKESNDESTSSTSGSSERQHVQKMTSCNGPGNVAETPDKARNPHVTIESGPKRTSPSNETNPYPEAKSAPTQKSNRSVYENNPDTILQTADPDHQDTQPNRNTPPGLTITVKDPPRLLTQTTHVAHNTTSGIVQTPCRYTNKESPSEKAASGKMKENVKVDMGTCVWHDPPTDRPWQRETKESDIRRSQGEKKLQDARDRLRPVSKNTTQPIEADRLRRQEYREHSKSEPREFPAVSRIQYRPNNTRGVNRRSDLTANHGLQSPSSGYRTLDSYYRQTSSLYGGKDWAGNGKAGQGKNETEQNEQIKDGVRLGDTERDKYTYSMKHPRRGPAIIFNNGKFDKDTRQRERLGYEKDGELMKDTFHRLGFDVQYHKDMGMTDMKRTMFVAAMDSYADCDCFVCVIMTHGSSTGNGDVVYATDGILYLDSLLVFFSGRGCPTLVGKPKLFFIQACRGNQLDEGSIVPDGITDETDASSTVRRLPVEADFLVAKATTPGHISFRNKVDGSIFIRSIAEVFRNHALRQDLMWMMTRVNHQVAFEFESCSWERPEFHDKKQMPEIIFRLTKHLYFTDKRLRKQ